jgi:NDP-sugar pyrophosphorylase family protein
VLAAYDILWGMIKQAVILAAGLGTRLRPYTDMLPKPMLPILGTPMLEWHIAQFKKHGVTEFFFNLHYLPGVIRQHFGDGSRFGVSIHYHEEPVILGTAGGVKSFESMLDDEFFLTYGDTFSLVDYSRMESVWYEKQNAIGMQRMKKTDEYIDADIAELDENGTYVAVHAKPHTATYQNAYRMRGTFILNRRILSYIPENTAYEISKQLLPDVMGHNESFYSYECDDYSKGIDTVEKWRAVEAYLSERGISYPALARD